jgi:hypothetical protein
MSTITFDTHQLVKELQQRGFSNDQAEGINDALKNALTVAEVATSKDIRELEHKLIEMEMRLTMKIGALIVAALGFLVALQKIL